MGLGSFSPSSFSRSRPRRVDEWQLIKEGNMAMAVILASIVISLGIVIAAAIHP